MNTRNVINNIKQNLKNSGNTSGSCRNTEVALKELRYVIYCLSGMSPSISGQNCAYDCESAVIDVGLVAFRGE